ncbi:MAG TPA: hypothetical protein GX706_00390 [Candidatus Moranbacteria bacterium]|nr:hypothetical protein [Candidatus Moranbacteria bacterium]
MTLIQKKLLFSLLTPTYLFIFFFSFPTNAQFIVEEEPTTEVGSESAIKTVSTFNQVYSIITFFMALLFLISLIGLITASIKLFIAGGSEKVLEEGRTILIYSLVAFVLSIFGYIMINLFKHVII